MPSPRCWPPRSQRNQRWTRSWRSVPAGSARPATTRAIDGPVQRHGRGWRPGPWRCDQAGSRAGRLMQASSGDGAMAAIIGLPDDRLDELIAAGAASASSPWPTATRPARSSSVDSALPSRRPWLRPGLWARAAASCCRSAWQPTRRSWRRPQPACAKPSPGSPSGAPAAPLLANADAIVLSEAKPVATNSSTT